jgi:hypothetical protein
MALVTINIHKSVLPVGTRDSHFGFVCEVGPEGQLFADIPEDMLQNELDHNRVTLVAKSADPKSLDDMKAGELIAYAAANGIDMGGLVAQSGKEKILAAIKGKGE